MSAFGDTNCVPILAITIKLAPRHGLFLQELLVIHMTKTNPALIQPGVSLMCSQKPAFGHCPDLIQSGDQLTN
jgi:hypothetical protein